MTLNALTCTVWFIVAVSGFGLGWIARSWVEARRRQHAKHLREITRTRKAVARPGTSESRVSQGRMTRTTTMKVNTESHVKDGNKLQ